MFHDLFVILNGEEEEQWMSTSDLFKCIKQKAGSAALRGGNIALSAILLPIWRAFFVISAVIERNFLQK